MKLTVCIGSSCHLKGSRQIVEVMIEQNNFVYPFIDAGQKQCMDTCQHCIATL